MRSSSIDISLAMAPTSAPCGAAGRRRLPASGRPLWGRWAAALSLVLALLMARPGHAETRVALIIGNAGYDNVLDLDNPSTDADAISDKLRGLGFDVLTTIDAKKADMIATIREFGQRVEQADVGLFYYAGHAIQYGGTNYLVPTDAFLRNQGDIDLELIDVNLVLRQLQDRTKTRLIFLDSCRDNPFEDLAADPRSLPNPGLAPVAASRGTFIAYATEPNHAAFDGIQDIHSPFARALLSYIDSPGLEVRGMMTKVRAEVVRATNGQQVPWDHSSLLSDFYFRPSTESAVAKADQELEQLNQVLAVADPEERLNQLRSFKEAHAGSALMPLVDSALQSSGRPTLQNPGLNRPPLLSKSPELVVEGGSGAHELAIPAPRDPDGDPLQITVVELPSSGTIRSRGRQVKVGDALTLKQLEAATYHLPPDVIGSVGQFTFQVADNRGGSVVGALPIRILKANQLPVMPAPEALVVTIGGPAVPIVREPPTDPDPDDRVIVRVQSGPAQGELTLDGVILFAGAAVTAEQLQRVAYQPPAEFVADAGAIGLMAEDGRGGETQRRIAITLNRQPDFGRNSTVDLVAGPAARPLAIAPPVDPDGDDLKVVVRGLPSEGGAVVVGERKLALGDSLSSADFAALAFQTEAGFSGYAGRLALEADDQRGGRSEKAVTLRIAQPNNPPILPDQSRALTAEVGRASPLQLGQPFDPDGQEVVVLIVQTPANGRILLDELEITPGSTVTPVELTQLRFMPDAGSVGQTSALHYAVGDGHGGATLGSIEISVVAANRPPVVANAEISTSSDRPPERLVKQAPSDPDGDPLTIEVVSLPASGRSLLGERALKVGDQLTLEQLSQIAFAASSDFVGWAGSFTYAVTDGRDGRSVGGVDIFVEPPNRPPIAASEAHQEVLKGRPATLLMRRPFDPDGDALSVQVTAVPARGSVLQDDRKIAVGAKLSLAELANLRFDPEAGEPGIAGRFSYAVRDDRGGEAQGGIELAIAQPNRPPSVPADVTLTVTAGDPAIPLLQDAAPKDPDNDPLTATILDVPETGEVRAGDKVVRQGAELPLADLARVTYSSAPTYIETAALFRYRIDDGRGGQAIGQIALIIEPGNRDPIAAPVPAFELQAGEAPARLPLDAPYDPDGDPLAVKLAALPELPGLVLKVGDRTLAVGDSLTADELTRLNLSVAMAAAEQTGELRFELSDGKGGQASTGVMVKVTAPPNRPPVVIVRGPLEVMQQGGPQPLGLEEPIDRDGDPVMVEITALPSSGRILQGDDALAQGAEVAPAELAALRFDPGDAGPGYAGSFELKAVDSKGASTLGRVPITIVTPPNRPPLIASQAPIEAVIGVGTLPLPVELPNDPDGDQLTIKITSVPQNGNLLFSGRSAASGMLLTVEEFADARFTPDPERPLIRGTASSLRYSADDGRGGAADGEVVIRSILHDCDRLASAAQNVDSVAPGVQLAAIEADPAIDACQAALAEYGNIVRFRFQLARAYQAKGSFREARDAYFVAAQAGDLAAQYNLGLLLIDPPPALADRPDIERGLFWMRKAGEAGLLPAQVGLAAVIWQQAQAGAAVDTAEAVHWLEQASQQDDPQALTELAMAYAEGRGGLAQDGARAASLLRRAAAQGYPPAQTNLGYLYAQGALGQPDYAEAERWFSVAADQQDGQALMNLGTMHLMGQGVARDPIKAVTSYAAAACVGGDAMAELAEAYLDRLSPSEEVLAAQSLLTAKGYDPGPIDGRIGPKTTVALERFEQASGQPPTGTASPALLLTLAGCPN